MYDEYKVEGALVSDAIEDEHGLYGKVPRTSTVRGRDDDGYGTYDECYQCTA
jgi:hypothetical protein